jgi:hypothetical protein
MESGGGEISGHCGFSCLIASRNIFCEAGNLKGPGTVYTGKTTRGVGG